MKKSILINFTVIFYPIILLALIKLCLPTTEAISRAYVTHWQLLASYIFYFLCSLVFSYIFLIKRKKCAFISIGLGFAICFVLLLPNVVHFLSLDAFVLLFDQPQSTILIFGNAMVIYFLMAFLHLKNRKFF